MGPGLGKAPKRKGTDSGMNRNLLRSTLLEALERAGRVLRRSLSRAENRRYTYKSGALNLVTAADRAAERAIIGVIRKRFPQHAILAEETGGNRGRAPYKWVIDPLDGTTNFAHGFPMACVSIGFEEAGQVMLGGVFEPFHGELFTAERGHGAYLNGRRIRVSATRELSRSLLATGFPYDRRRRADYYLSIYKAFMGRSHGVRRCGAAAIDLAYVACGRFDGFWEMKLSPWDVSAGALLVEEAGGIISNFDGSSYDRYGAETLASNGRIHPEMIKVLKGVL